MNSIPSNQFFGKEKREGTGPFLLLCKELSCIKYSLAKQKKIKKKKKKGGKAADLLVLDGLNPCKTFLVHKKNKFIFFCKKKGQLDIPLTSISLNYKDA